MKRLTFILLLFISMNITAQSVVTNDTLFIYMNEEFRIPKDSVSSVKNIRYIDVEAFYEKDNNSVSIINKMRKNNFPLRTFRRTSSFYCYFFDTLFVVGSANYHVQHNYQWTEYENGPRSSGRREEIYPVKVLLPTLASSDSLRSIFYLGESLQFSFATIEYNKVDNYSYSVYANNKMVDSSYGKGTPFVNLDSLLNNSNYADNTITINGFYNKKSFKYNSPTGIKSSTWKFTIKKPILDSDSFWHQNDPTIIPIICANNPKSAIFYFTFLGSTAKQRAIMLGPEIKNLKWEGSVIQSARVTSRPNAVYGTIRIIYNMGAVPVFSSIDEVPETTIRLEFDTQYGHETYSWKAKIFQVQ